MWRIYGLNCPNVVCYLSNILCGVVSKTAPTQEKHYE